MKMFITLCAILWIGIGSGCGQETFVQEGIASYYGHEFHGRRTSSGEQYSKHKLTGAHPTLAFGTKVKVTNLDNGKSVVVKINDRGPSSKKRIIDVSYAAAKKLGMLVSGTANVRIESIHLSFNERSDSTEEVKDEGPSKELIQLEMRTAKAEGWAIQIGSFSEMANLIRLVDIVKKTYNRPVLMDMATSDEKPIYRILIGPEKTEESAKALLILVKKDYPEAFIAPLQP